MQIFEFVERRTLMTEGDLLDYTRCAETIEAIKTICRRQPQKRKMLRGAMNAAVRKIATINARYE